MNKQLDYYKSVDIIDEGVMMLTLKNDMSAFPGDLKEKLIQILDFIKRAELPEYTDLLFDKRITISKERLNIVHKNVKELEFSVDRINETIALLTNLATISSDDVEKLKSHLLEFSHPLWISTKQ